MPPSTLPRFRRTLFLAVPLLLASAISSRANSIASETFEGENTGTNTYVVGSGISGLNQGYGWAGPWSGVSGVTISDESITRSLGANTAGGGKCLKIASDSETTLSRFINPVPGGIDVYVSFIFQPKGGPSGTAVSGNVFAGWQALDANPSSSNDTIGFLGLSGKAGARVKNESTSFASSLVYGRTDLFVIKYTGWNGSVYTTAQVWLNPTSHTDEFATSSTITLTKTNSTGGSSGFLGLRARTVGLSASAYYLVDDIRIGTTWEDVADFPVTITANANWGSYDHSLNITRGGVFDYSGQLDAPAGKYGFITRNAAGHLEFAGRPGVRARFWGPNVVQTAQFLSHADSDMLAERLALSGYNIVRLHLPDYPQQPGASSSIINNSEAALHFDQQDYLIKALKERGIYIVIDLFPTRNFSATEIASFGLSTNAEAQAYFNTLVHIDSDLRQSWREFAANFMSRVNPYTSLSLANDPVLVAICPLNESPLHRSKWEDALVKPLFQAAFTASGGTGSLADNNPSFVQFMYEKNAATDGLYRSYLDTLGVHALVTGGGNYTVAQGLTLSRKDGDYVDNHQYWDHPDTWSFPYGFSQNNDLSARAYLPGRTMPSRIFGLPFFMTEFHFSRPNRFRAEGLVIMPAYASLQDWDAMFNFDYARDVNMVQGTATDNYFALATDPVSLIGDRVGALLFLRGDISPANGSIAWAVRSAEAYTTLNQEFEDNYFRSIALVTKVGSQWGDPAAVLAANSDLDAVVTGNTPNPGALPAKAYAVTSTIATRLQDDGIIPAGSISSDGKNTITSDTGQIQLCAADSTLKVVTPRSELFVLAPGLQLTGNRVSVVNGQTTGAVMVVALDQPDGDTLSLDTANRILVTHLTDALATDTKFDHPDRHELRSWGEFPHLVQTGDATLILQLPAGDWKAFSVDATGARVGTFPLTALDGNAWEMELATVNASGTRLAYELDRVNYNAWGFPTSSRASLGSAGWAGWGANGTSTATTFTTTSLGYSNTLPRLGLLNGTGSGGGLGAVFAHTGSTSTASSRHDHFALTTVINPLATGGAGQLNLVWEQAFNQPTLTSVRVLVRVNGNWYASANSFTVDAASTSWSMTNAETHSLDLAGSSGLGTTQWHATTLGDGQPIITNADLVTTSIGTNLEGIGFLINTDGGISRVAFVDNVRLVFGTTP